MSALPQRAFRGVRAFLTGHTGFKGAWLSEWLVNDGAIVAGMALPPGEPSLFADLGLTARMTSISGDIRDSGALERAVTEFAPEIIFHLAAQAIVRESYSDPVGTFATNVMGTVHLLEAARRCPSVRAIVCVTSDKCYDNRDWAWGYRENDALGGRDPYSASKAAAEIVAGSYLRSLFPLEGRVRLATARAGNVIGGGDWAVDRLIPDLVRAIAEGRPVVLRNPEAVRPWQHVLEPLRGYLELGRGLLDGGALEGAWNFGPGHDSEIQVAEIVRLFTRTWGHERTAQPRHEASAFTEAQTLRLDISKAHARLFWHPTLDLCQTVEMTADWYRQRANSPRGAAKLIRTQLETYKAATSMS